MKTRTFKHEKTKWIAERLYEGLYQLSGEQKSGAFQLHIPAELIENSSDWQEITKDYEILKVRNEYGSILTDNNTFDGWDIYSVKRLSDGEVFSLGDEVQSIRFPITIRGKVTKIKEEDGQIKIHHDWNEHGFNYLHEIEKSRQPILTTEDGVELLDGDKHWWMDDNNMHIGEDLTDKSDPAKGYKYFSTREAAEDYRLWNYKGLSLKDINDNCDIFEDHFTNLEELVKSRLK